MISIFSQIDKELRSWIAIWRFLRGLDHYGLNFYLPDAKANARHKAPAPQPGYLEIETEKPTFALHAK